jgi:hypothetical protein
MTWPAHPATDGLPLEVAGVLETRPIYKTSGPRWYLVDATDQVWAVALGPRENAERVAALERVVGHVVLGEVRSDPPGRRVGGVRPLVPEQLPLLLVWIRGRAARLGEFATSALHWSQLPADVWQALWHARAELPAALVDGWWPMWARVETDRAPWDWVAPVWEAVRRGEGGQSLRLRYLIDDLGWNGLPDDPDLQAWGTGPAVAWHLKQPAAPRIGLARALAGWDDDDNALVDRWAELDRAPSPRAPSDPVEARRWATMVQARAAERAVAVWARDEGREATDVSHHQVTKESERWETHDVELSHPNGAAIPVDVKHSRLLTFHHESRVETRLTVSRLKRSRHGGGHVWLVGAVTPRLAPGDLADELARDGVYSGVMGQTPTQRATCTILGWASLGSLTKLRTLVGDEDVEVVPEVARDGRLPQGWIAPWAFALRGPDAEAATATAWCDTHGRRVLSHWLGDGGFASNWNGTPSALRAWLLGRRPLPPAVAERFPVAARLLARLAQDVGFAVRAPTLPELYVATLVEGLAALRTDDRDGLGELADTVLGSPEGPGPLSTRRRPAIVAADPLRTLDTLCTVLRQLGRVPYEVRARIASVHLAANGILTARLAGLNHDDTAGSSDRWTLVAYCGQRKPGPSGARTGAWCRADGLVLGDVAGHGKVAGSCPGCGGLVCRTCGGCKGAQLCSEQAARDAGQGRGVLPLPGRPSRPR